MKHAKSHAGDGGRGAGVSSILTNYGAYRRWARTAHEQSRYVDVTLQMAEMTDSETGRTNKHHDVRPSQIRKSDVDQLFCLASGALSLLISVTASWMPKKREAWQRKSSSRIG